MYTGRNPRAKELKKIITDPHFKVKKKIYCWAICLYAPILKWYVTQTSDIVKSSTLCGHFAMEFEVTFQRMLLVIYYILTQLKLPSKTSFVVHIESKLWHFWFLSSATPTMSVYLLSQALIEAHDDIAAKNFEHVPEFLPVFAPPPQVFQVPPADAIRMVGIRKTPDEPLVCHSFVQRLFTRSFIHLSICVLTRVPTWNGKPGKLGRHFPVREKSGNFEQTEKVREKSVKTTQNTGNWDKLR